MQSSQALLALRGDIQGHSADPAKNAGALTSSRDRVPPMSENNPTRREVLLGMAAVLLLGDALEAQATASSVCFMSTIEMARLIRTKKLSARGALARHLRQI